MVTRSTRLHWLTTERKKERIVHAWRRAPFFVFLLTTRPFCVFYYSKMIQLTQICGFSPIVGGKIRFRHNIQTLSYVEELINQSFPLHSWKGEKQTLIFGLVFSYCEIDTNCILKEDFCLKGETTFFLEREKYTRDTHLGRFLASHHVPKQPSGPISKGRSITTGQERSWKDYVNSLGVW